MKAMTHSVDNDLSQQAVELVVVGLGFVEQCWLRNLFGRPASMNWGELGKWLCNR